MVPKTQHLKTCFCKSGITHCIGDFPRIACMLTTIKFNDNLHLEACKIHDVSTEGYLSAKLEILSPCTKSTPEVMLRSGLLFSQSTGGGSEKRLLPLHKLSPLTLALSRQGRGNVFIKHGS